MSAITNSTNRLLLLGPSYFGKEIVAQKLAAHLKIPHISTHAIFRAHLAEHTAFSQKVRNFMRGELNHTLVSQITLDALNSLKEGFILDDYPKTLDQAHVLHAAYGWPSVIHLDASEDTMIGKLVGRVSCVACGTVFYHLNHPPKEEGVCDHCHSELVLRKDDPLFEKAVKWLKTYHSDSEPLVSLYRENGVLTTIDTGNLTPNEIYKKVIRNMFSEHTS